MQGYSYSVFSAAAIVIHLIINFDLLAGGSQKTVRGMRYRGFLAGVLFYYVTDAAWGILAGLGQTRLLYADTVLFFLALAIFALMWCRFVIAYLGFGKWSARILSLLGYGLLAVNCAMLTANLFDHCVFSFDEQGNYLLGAGRHLLFDLLIAFHLLVAGCVMAKVCRSGESVRSRNMMIFVNCLTMTLAIALQVIWPLTPFTALGCLIGNCFLHVFVIRDEQLAKHMVALENALERARAAEKARSMFFSVVSHDIRTPLNAILGYSELLRRDAGSPEEKTEALNAIRASGTTLLRLVDDVLDLAKMDAGMLELRPVPVRLTRLTEEVFAAFRMAAAEKGIVLVDSTDAVPTVLLDEQRIRQILFNLVGNAVKFTERGSVTVAASCAGSTLEISVADTGCGIAADMLTRILNPFVQVQDPTHGADRSGGTGMGLPICRGLVEAMGGELVVDSEPGRGSTFRVRLPGIAFGEEAAERSAAPEAEDGGKSLPKRVLVADDSPVNRKVLTAFLKRAGIVSVHQACDGAEAFAELDSAAAAGMPYDFVLSDLWMPNMNGFELIVKLRDDPRFGRLPVFAVTADTECRSDDRTARFDGVLFKPLTYDKLAEILSVPSANVEAV